MQSHLLFVFFILIHYRSSSKPVEARTGRFEHGVMCCGLIATEQDLEYWRNNQARKKNLLKFHLSLLNVPCECVLALEQVVGNSGWSNMLWANLAHC